MSGFNEKARQWLQQEGVNTEQPSTSASAEPVEPAAAGVDSAEVEVLRERLAALEAEAEWNRLPDIEKRRRHMEASRENFSTQAKVWGHDPAETKILPPRAIDPPRARGSDVIATAYGGALLTLRDGRVVTYAEANELGVDVSQQGYYS